MLGLPPGLMLLGTITLKAELGSGVEKRSFVTAPLCYNLECTL